MNIIIWIIALFSFLYIIRRQFRERWFAYLMNKLSHTNYKMFGSAKTELFKPLHDMQAKSKGNGITLLEIGVGIGVNFRYYPDGTKLIVVDPNPHCKQYYEENEKKFKNITSEEVIVTKGEEMDMIKSNSVDVVVLTHVFCCVDNAQAIFRQIHRVLRPGGKYFFFEHILEFDKKHYIRKILQQVLTIANVWPYLCDNCHLNRNMLPYLQKAGFSSVDAKHIHLKIEDFALRIVEPHLVGVATK